MALPVPESAAGPREDIIRLLAGAPGGLTDSGLAAALVHRHPDLNAKAVNHQCRRLIEEGRLERVGSRPSRVRLVLTPAQDIVQTLESAPDGLSDAELAETLAGRHPTLDAKAVNHQCRKLVTSGVLARVGSRPIRNVVVGGLRAVEGGQGKSASRVEPEAPDDDAAAPASGSTTTSVAETAEPEASEPAPKPTRRSRTTKTGSAGKRVESTAPGPVAAPEPAGTEAAAPEAEPAATEPDTTPEEAPQQDTEPATDEAAASSEPATPEPAANAEPATPEPAAQTEPEPITPPAPIAPVEAVPRPLSPPSRRPRRRAKTPSDDVARIRRSERDDWAPDDPDEPLLRFLPFASAASARTALRERMAERAALRRVPDPPDEVVVPIWDVLQGWSRTQNVAAAVAGWLTRRGGRIRAAHASGPAHDLVAALDGDDIHVEVTGWPPDGARTHPTTLAADWFHAAARAAAQRRRAHPQGRVVIALPDTRRYRALVDDDAEVLRRARTEIWFVGPEGEIQLS
jgi:hypothetical protein